ncbi:hypothetical protein P7C71_g4133, partial [Lecanoromycetidae sp. Uapishka_2]
MYISTLSLTSLALLTANTIAMTFTNTAPEIQTVTQVWDLPSTTETRVYTRSIPAASVIYSQIDAASEKWATESRHHKLPNPSAYTYTNTVEMVTVMTHVRTLPSTTETRVMTRTIPPASVVRSEIAVESSLLASLYTASHSVVEAPTRTLSESKATATHETVKPSASGAKVSSGASAVSVNAVVVTGCGLVALLAAVM